MNDFEIKLVDGIVVVKIEIIIATHGDVKPLWDEFEDKLIFNHDKIVIDLSFCNGVDSTFMGMIIKILRRVKEKNGQLVLIFPERNLAEIFRVNGLEKVIPCYNTLPEAFEYFTSKAEIQALRMEGTNSSNRFTNIT